MTSQTADEQFIRRALDLAAQGIGLASPNPCVGAVVVDSHGNIVATGAYSYDGLKHAEIRALETAGEKARGATLYINLEPCSHQGRTPPCADAVIAAGIRRVVASMTDPNPAVAGRGFEKLKAAGIQVETGLCQSEARRLNESFANFIQRGIPLVTLKAAMTLDGRIALPPGNSPPRTIGIPRGGWITGEDARAHAHELRHRHDAILAGVGTVLADDPLLTDRSGHPRRRPLLRVILDSHLRLPLDSRLVQSVRADDRLKSDVLVFCSSAQPSKQSQLEKSGVRVEQVPAAARDGCVNLVGVLRRLGQLEITSVLVEGGAAVYGNALESEVIDKVFLYYAPTIVGGTVPFLAGPGPQALSSALRLKSFQLHRFKEDFAVEGYLRDPL